MNDELKTNINNELIDKVSLFPTAALHEAYDRQGALPSIIKPLNDSFTLTGCAVTVEVRPGDNLVIHHAIYKAKKGDVLVVDAKGYTEAGPWGEIMTRAAIKKGIAGLVIFGCVRDKNEIVESGFPVFSIGVCIKGTTKLTPGSINKTICISDVEINPGDVIRGDSDGVIAIKYNMLNEVILNAEKIIEKETAVLEKIKEGKSTLEIYNLKSLQK